MNPWEWTCGQSVDCICGNDCDLISFRDQYEEIEDDYDCVDDNLEADADGGVK